MNRLAFTPMTDSRQLLAAVAAATHPLVPFDRLGLARVEDADAV